MCIFREVYCFHCGTKFEKQNQNPSMDDFENCPNCKKGFDDLSEESQFAVKMVLKPFEGVEL